VALLVLAAGWHGIGQLSAAWVLTVQFFVAATMAVGFLWFGLHKGGGRGW
jgi:hypothetical protein